MLYRLSSLILSLVLITACGKTMPQPSINEPSNPSLHGMWAPTDQNHDPAIVLAQDDRIAFVYPALDGQEQAQDVHNITPLSWNVQGQDINITAVNMADNTSTTMSYALSSPTTLALKTADNAGIFSTNYTKSDISMGTIQGSLFYRERMMLPPDAVAIITLQETSRADASAIIMSSMAIGEANRTPLSFQIPYNKSDILDNNRYSLRACIMSQGTLLFSTTNAYPVLRKGQADPASVDLLLHRVLPADEQSATQSLQNTYWALQSLHGQAAEQFEGQEAPHLILDNEGKSSGSDGCNRFFGTYSTHEQHITFFPGGSTMMLCPQGDKQAAVFMSSLQESTAYQITDNNLELLRGKDVIATFVAKPMP